VRGCLAELLCGLEASLSGWGAPGESQNAGGPSGVSRKRMGLKPKQNGQQEPQHQQEPFQWNMSKLTPDDIPSWAGPISPLLRTLPPPPRLEDFVAAYHSREQQKQQQDIEGFQDQDEAAGTPDRSFHGLQVRAQDLVSVLAAGCGLRVLECAQIE
jgi:hypothetical protein